MAKKKTEEQQGKQFVVDVNKLTLTKENYIDNLGRFIMEHLPKTETKRDGNILKISVPTEVNKKMVNLRITKFLYQAGLKNQYKVVALPNAEKNGFQILEA